MRFRWWRSYRMIHLFLKKVKSVFWAVWKHFWKPNYWIHEKRLLCAYEKVVYIAFSDPHMSIHVFIFKGVMWENLSLIMWCARVLLNWFWHFLVYWWCVGVGRSFRGYGRAKEAQSSIQLSRFRQSIVLKRLERIMYCIVSKLWNA